MPDYYTRSNGETVDIKTLHPAHLISAIAKLERTDPDSDELPAMKELAAEHARQFAAEEAAKEQMR